MIPIPCKYVNEPSPETRLSGLNLCRRVYMPIFLSSFCMLGVVSSELLKLTEVAKIATHHCVVWCTTHLGASIPTEPFRRASPA